MTETQTPEIAPATCGTTTEHKAHRHFDGEGVSRPCSGLPDHRAPLAPGEIRMHRIGNAMFTVMHVAGGSFTQATMRNGNDSARVLCTDRFADVAVRAYADAIEQAESNRIDALDDADGPSYDASGAYLDGDGRAPSGPLTPASLASLLDAYGEAMAKGATCIVLGRRAELVAYAARADELKASILARFGGGR